jgi:hypothetical protein
VGDTRLEKGATTSINMSCRNHTTVNIQRVYARLVQRCVWKAWIHSHRWYRLLMTHDFDRFAGLDRLDELPSPSRAQYSMEEVYESIFRESQEGTHSTNFHIPVDALNSYQGSLISVNHFLTISAETRCCIDQPTIQIPLSGGRVAQRSRIHVSSSVGEQRSH